jgi:NADPH:quinone reductase-like Zn-dependent oxidoreductase
MLHQASTVSISDCEIRRNLNRNILWPIPLPICPGQDLVGRIVYIGQKIRKYGTFQLGDRVCSIHKFLGGNSKYIGLSGAKLIPCPDDVDAAEACCIVRSYLAAYQILYRTGTFELDHHHKILVTGANGNIGRAVIDLAKLARAKVYGAAGARHKRFVQSVLGVPWVHSDPVNWSRLHDIDVVVDCVNYTGNFNDSCTPLIRGGILIRVGSSKYVSDVIHRQRMEIENLDYEFDSGDEDIGKMCGALTPGSKKSAVYSNSMFKHIPLKYGGGLQLSMFATQISYDLFNNIENHWHGCKDDLDYLFAMLSRGKLTPTIAHRISLEQVQKAHKMLETGGLQGTIVCVGEKSRRLPKKQLSKKEIAIKVK